MNEQLEDDLFTFSPPAGAKLVSSFEFPGMKNVNSAIKAEIPAAPTAQP